ncbi:HpcH/HpaI aldolase family protein [Streptomyces olindensis]|uniref:HpcH/HpaI aldolase family protein n=1 Tax=Streptomyces olindensis TaxID=358823 RepID=UPI003648B346
MNNLPERLRGPKPLLGTLVTVASPEVAEALAITGVEWLFLDAEHSPVMHPAAVQSIVQAVAGRSYTLVRVPKNDETWIKSALDAGADGVIVPHIKNAEDVEWAVGWAKYPPLGKRSVGITRAHSYGADFAGYLERANAATALVLQIEDIEAVEALPEILSIPGVDALFIGPYDLSGSMGRLGEVQDPDVQEAIETVVAASNRHGIPIGAFAATAAGAKAEVKRGIGFIAVGTDLGHLTGAVANSLATLSEGS